MQWKPNVTVAAIVQQDDRYLIVEEESDGRIVLNQPAGHLEKDETLFEAIKREVMEETAWEFDPEAVVGLYMHPNKNADITYLRVCFAGTCSRHYPDKALDEGILRAIWLTKEELLAEKNRLRNNMVLRCIDDYLSGKQYPLDLLSHYL